MIFDLLSSHTSIRKYKNSQLSKEQISELISVAQHAASSHFVQAYSVVWVTDEQIKKKIGELSKNMIQMETAGAVLVCCVDFQRLHVAGLMNDTTIVTDSAENVLVGTADVAIFAQNLAIAAESKGYGICYIGGVRNKPTEISELLDLPERVFPVFAMTVGVPDEQHEVKPRLPVEAILHENGYDSEKYHSLLSAYDKTMEEYYETRGSNQKSTNWTKSMADFLKVPRRTHIKGFLASRGFTWK
nr:oxygen-insensitive NADPH nitroreductase [Paenisporosarcina indica]